MKPITKTSPGYLPQASTFGLVLLTVYLALMSTLGIMAAVPRQVEKTANEQVRTEIVRQINCPDFIKENSDANNVEAVISVDTNGKIIVYSIHSENDEAGQYVTQTLHRMKMPEQINTGKFALLVKFRVA